jgi:hypothetical protein
VALSEAAIGILVLPIAAAQAGPTHSSANGQSSGTPDGSLGGLLDNLKPDQITNQLLNQVGGLAVSTDTPSATATAPGAVPGSTPSATASQPSAPATGPSEFCGPERTTNKVTAEACLEFADGVTSARAYVTNASSVAQTVALVLSRTNQTSIQIECTVAPGSSKSICDTPTMPNVSGVSQDAIAEIVAVGAPISAGVVRVESGMTTSE